ncbi:Methyltransferase domain-containing protein [Persephonella hydrogeniphila]|uniref:Methyltransferase domain-containing protein n=1 Tax=Persephonella hydrogeniphila TaxID=198703 RepID=A0A285N741_9AQUI|nr:class I SAM-dependent methyltransferase [Persephonella hydrogeniphila]SNZ03786.1 Methyltransferase domain-containing protein [Persephonella hydrogeniphila]
MDYERAVKDWTDFYTKEVDKLKAYPSEELIRIFKGEYVGKLPVKNKKILDIGFGNGENFILYSELGMDIFGVEISDEICQQVYKHFSKYGIDIKLRTGSNTNIPFPDNFFDYIVSWNVIHYEDNEENLKKALNEYRRVLKPEGKLILSTVGEKHGIKKGGHYISKNIFLVQRKDDFRYGEKFFYFENENEIKKYFSIFFKDIKIGRTFQNLFNEDKIIDHFLVFAVK